jgi:tetratricopeptide (TPR) repeat protein
LLFQLGEVEMWQGDYLQAQEHLADSLDLAQQTNDERLLAEALSRLGWVAYYRGELSQGQQWLEQAITHARASGAQSVLVLALRQMGNVVSAQGGYDRARTCYEESLATARALNDHNSVAFVLNNLGTLELLTGHFDAAARYLHESLEICRTANNILGSAFALGNLVVNSYLTKDYAQARSYYEQQNALNQKLNTLVLVAEVEIWIGLTALATGSQAEARLHMSQALRVALQIDESPLVLAGLAAFARLEAAAGRPEEALELLGAVIDDPAMDDVVRVHVAKPLLAELHQALPPAAIPQIQARGRTNNPLTLARKLAGG